MTERREYFKNCRTGGHIPIASQYLTPGIIDKFSTLSKLLSEMSLTCGDSVINNHNPNALKLLPGQRFNRFTIVSRAENNRHGQTMFNVVCDCGKTRVVNGHTIKSGKSKSCGCILRTAAHYNKNLNSIWRLMEQRCNNKNHPSYSRYGGRGIKVCKRWEKFENFLKDMGAKPTPSHTLDRINNDGDYTPANCRWATRREQNNNASFNKHITFKNKRYTLAEMARELKMSISKFYWRYKKSGRPKTYEEVIEVYGAE